MMIDIVISPSLDCFDSELLKMDFRKRRMNHNQNIRLFSCESRFPFQDTKMIFLSCGHSDFTCAMTVVSVLLVTKIACCLCLRYLLDFTHNILFVLINIFL